MNIQKFAKQEIALRQIETALGLYFGKGDLFSAITLAGAAEEILGQLLQLKSEGEGLGAKLTSIFKILRPRSAKGDVQEGFTGHQTETFVHMDAHHEAVFLLGRAIEDYVALTGQPTAAMLRFLSEMPVSR